MTTPASAALSIRKSYCRPMPRPLSLTVQPCGTAWSFTRKPGTPQLAREIDAALPIELSREDRSGLSVNTVPLNLFQKKCALILPFTTPTAATPIVISCLPCAPLTSAAHGRRKSKKEYDLDENGERIRLPSADTRHTKLTSQAGTTRATRFYGARHGRIFQTPTLNAPDTRSVSTTAATPSAAH